MAKLMKAGDLVAISDSITKHWPQGHQWGFIAIITKIEAMEITLLCSTGFVRELPVQLSSQYLKVINEAR